MIAVTHEVAEVAIQRCIGIGASSGAICDAVHLAAAEAARAAALVTLNRVDFERFRIETSPALQLAYWGAGSPRSPSATPTCNPSPSPRSMSPVANRLRVDTEQQPPQAQVRAGSSADPQRPPNARVAIRSGRPPCGLHGIDAEANPRLPGHRGLPLQPSRFGEGAKAVEATQTEAARLARERIGLGLRQRDCQTGSDPARGKDCCRGSECQREWCGFLAGETRKSQQARRCIEAVLQRLGMRSGARQQIRAGCGRHASSSRPPDSA